MSITKNLERDNDRLMRRVLLSAFVLFSAAKLIAVFFFIPPDSEIYDLEFGFGPYIKSLCEHSAFMGENNLRASRMPFLPMFFAALSSVSTNMRIDTILKNLILSGVFLASFSFLLRAHMQINKGASTFWCAVCVLLALSLPVIKHSSAAMYEEGIILEILFLWTFAFLLSVESFFAIELRNYGARIVTCMLLFALVTFLTKSSMLLMFLSSAVLATTWGVRFRNRHVLVVVCLCVAVIASWGLRNLLVTDHFNILTSQDGENAVRGWNSEAMQLYPDVTLDQLWFPGIAYLADGKEVLITQKRKVEDFPDEWASNDYYMKQARDWGIANPWKAAIFTSHKLYYFFISVTKTPYTFTNDARTSGGFTFKTAVISLWLFIGRILQLAMLSLMVVLWRRGDFKTRTVVAAAAVTNVVYAFPYLVGFNYERHVTVYLVIVAACVAFLSSELFRLRGERMDNMKEVQSP